MAEEAFRTPEHQGMLSACFFGFNSPYQPTLFCMHELHQQVARSEIPDQLMLLEHESVITITRQHLLRSIITSEEAIKNDNIALVLADRGGDATFHGPGQLVGYPIMMLRSKNNLEPDIGGYVCTLERALLNAVHIIGVKQAVLLPGFRGIWVKCRDGHGQIPWLRAHGKQNKLR